MAVSINSASTRKKKRFRFKGGFFKKKKVRPDDDSIVGVTVERIPSAQSADSPSSSAQLATSTIQVVLLLMDPNSRRFELLQLEFDSDKALVSDVLSQISHSATEQTLRDMDYGGVCDRSGTEMISSMKLSQFCKSNDVVMAMPRGMKGGDTAKLSSPILGDPHVVSMLVPIGVKVESKAKRKIQRLPQISEERKKTKRRSTSRAKGETKKQSSSSSSLPTAILTLLLGTLAIFTGRHHCTITKTLNSGDLLLPGNWISQCGVFDLLPALVFDLLPASVSEYVPTCDLSVSSMLQLDDDGTTLRYFSKNEEGKRVERWIANINPAECTNEDETCELGVKFVKDGQSWYAERGGSRSHVNKNVVTDFMLEEVEGQEIDGNE